MPIETPDNLNNNSYVRFLDVWGEGEVAGLATPLRQSIANAGQLAAEQLKDIFVDNTPILRSQATVLAGTYSQQYSRGTIACTYTSTDELITVTTVGAAAHQFNEQDEVSLTFTTGNAATDTYVVQEVLGSSSFTVTNLNGEVTS